MRLQDSNYGFESNLPDDGEEATFEFSSKMVDILSDHIYKDKVLAVIRELICNAYDAHVEAGKADQPIRVFLPNRFDQIFAVEDDGIGIPPEKMGKIYLTYGGSTKTHNNDTIGALGLGSKSPIAYTKSSFIVKSRWDGVERTYFIYKDEKGKPRLNKVGEEETDRPNGIRVELAVKQQDIGVFRDRLDRFLKYWRKTMPFIVNVDSQEEVLTSKINKIINGDWWYLEERDSSADFKGALAVMGNIPYPIEVEAIPNMPENLKLIAQNSFVIDFDLGTLAFQPSREALSFDEFTSKNLIAKLEVVRQELTKSFLEKIFRPGQTHIEFRFNFNETVSKFADTIRKETIDENKYYGAGKHEWAVQMLLNKSSKDTVDYNGYTFTINDLLNNSHKVFTNAHLPFALTAEDTRKNGKVYFHNTTSIEFRLKPGASLGYKDIYPESSVLPRPLSSSDVLDFEWKSSVLPNRKDEDDYSSVHRALQNIDKFDVRTINRLHFTKKEVVFIVSDEGGAGENKFKAFVSSIHRGNANYFFVKFNQREADVLQTIAAVGKFIAENGMSGVKIDVTSNLDDYRAQIERVKRDRGTIKLSKYEFTLFPNHQQSEVEVYGSRKVLAPKMVVPKTKDEHVETLFDIDALKKSGTIIYVRKKMRSKTETHEPNHYGRSIFQNETSNVRLAAKMGMLDNLHREAFTDTSGAEFYRYLVLVLNDGQVTELRKKGVKLTGLHDHIKPQVEAMFNQHNYLQDIVHDAEMESMSWIRKVYSSLSRMQREALISGPVHPDLPSNETTFVQKLREYATYIVNRNKHLDSYAMLTLLKSFVNSFAKPKMSNIDIDEVLEDQYPLLAMMNGSSIHSDNLHEIFSYMATVDAGRMVAVHTELKETKTIEEDETILAA